MLNWNALTVTGEKSNRESDSNHVSKWCLKGAALGVNRNCAVLWNEGTGDFFFFLWLIYKQVQLINTIGVGCGYKRIWILHSCYFKSYKGYAVLYTVKRCRKLEYYVRSIGVKMSASARRSQTGRQWMITAGLLLQNRDPFETIRREKTLVRPQTLKKMSSIYEEYTQEVKKMIKKRFNKWDFGPLEGMWNK